jgi:hypothetical protein
MEIPMGEPFPLRKILLALLIIILIASAVGYTAVSRSSPTLGAPSSFTATAGNRQNTLSWNKKYETNQVLIRCKTTGYPTSVTDGTLIYEGTGTNCTHTNLEYGRTYYYGIWSARVVKEEWEYSDKGAFASGIPYWRGLAGEETHEYVEHNRARMVGADGNTIELFNSPEAGDPTWQELKEFLWEDKTDQLLYNQTFFVCADFAEMLHNNAEKNGLRAGFVTVDLGSQLHALNIFNTTNKGLIFIDDTGLSYSHSFSADKIVAVNKGSEYQPEPIFDPTQWESTGTVIDIWIQW